MKIMTRERDLDIQNVAASLSPARHSLLTEEVFIFKRLQLLNQFPFVVELQNRACI